MISYPKLVGHSFTEKPGITITKTPYGSIFKRYPNQKLCLFLNDKVTSDTNYTGSFYVNGSIRGKPEYKFYLMPGEYNFENQQSSILVLNISDNELNINKNILINRAKIIDNEKTDNILSSEDLNRLNVGNILSNEQIDNLKNYFTNLTLVSRLVLKT